MTTWIYIEKDRDGSIVDIDAFGSLRKLNDSKEIYIKGFKLPEGSLRILLKKNNDDFRNEAYVIKKVQLKTKKHTV